MKTLIPFFILVVFITGADAQLISRFTWENNPVTAAEYGPNALSSSSYATVIANGANGTKGLNAGAGQNDINLVLDGSYYNVPALDISVDFRREESVASFFYRGTYFNLGMISGNLSVSFLLTSAAAFTTVNSGNIYAVPDDHSFHNYHFAYDNNTGIARVLVDGTVVYTYKGIAGTPLYWTGAGNVTIGKDMDGTGRNVSILDNLIIQKYANALLPLKLLSFTAESKSKYVSLNWSSTQEINVASFIVERSLNGASFSALATVTALNGYTTVNHYAFTDSLSSNTVSYYRLKMVNGDGTYTYSNVKTINIASALSAEISVFPNPTADYVNIKLNNTGAGQYRYLVCSITGQLVTAADVQPSSGTQVIKIDLTKTSLKGMMVIQIINTQNNTSKSFTIFKTSAK